MLTKVYTIYYPKQNEHRVFLLGVCAWGCKSFNWVEFLMSFLRKLIWTIIADIPKDGCPLTVTLLSVKRSLMPDDMSATKHCSWRELTNSRWRPLVQAGTLQFSHLGSSHLMEKSVTASHWQWTTVKGQHRVLPWSPELPELLTFLSSIGQLFLQLSKPPRLFSINPQNQREPCPFISLVRQIIDKICK